MDAVYLSSAFSALDLIVEALYVWYYAATFHLDIFGGILVGRIRCAMTGEIPSRKPDLAADAVILYMKPLLMT